MTDLKLNIASYNIQYGTGQDGVYDLGRIIETLRGQDIICLQEVTTHWQVCDFDDQAALIAKALNLYACYEPSFELDASDINASGSIVNKRRGFGNMVLSRWPIIYSRLHSLPRPATEMPEAFFPLVDIPRAVLETVINVDGVAIRVMSIHLSHLPGEQRHHQINILKNLCQTLPNEAPLWDEDPSLKSWTQGQATPPIPQNTLMLGDFNFGPGSDNFQQMTTGDNALLDAWSILHGTKERPGTCVEQDGSLSSLDYLFVTRNVEQMLRSVTVDQNIIASDHFPLFFELAV